MKDDLYNFMKKKFNLSLYESINLLQLVTVARECHKKKIYIVISIKLRQVIYQCGEIHGGITTEFLNR
jgi:hypothetical protein